MQDYRCLVSLFFFRLYSDPGEMEIKMFLWAYFANIAVKMLAILN